MKTRKRAQALILTFDYEQLVDDGNYSVLKNSGMDYEYDTLRKRWALYVMDNSKPNPAMMGFFRYVSGAQNLHSGLDYLDLYIKVNSVPENNLYIRNSQGIWKNIRFKDFATVDVTKIKFEFEVNSMDDENLIDPLI